MPEIEPLRSLADKILDKVSTIRSELLCFVTLMLIFFGFCGALLTISEQKHVSYTGIVLVICSILFFCIFTVLYMMFLSSRPASEQELVFASNASEQIRRHQDHN